ncbi:ABC transporter permease [Thiothrix fructosivorans]|uniref:ABC transporter permease n=1 Tax=Thiothrix fructosivorans TaxID=111770 RepID=A0A8B0SKQ3_9GAMM|nr:FtsX-like permease family protein [Thiothrix fructosivorans]MBO0613505.1 ABC transporter permease [Thiothrix fructosivorans]QTX11070.1 ABC transporter permease [Thiothrix fructosivorans]
MNSAMPFEWILAIRFMRQARMQTLLIMAGVALGVSVIVFISALISGLQTNLFKRTLDFQAQIIILPPKEVSRPLHQAEDGAMLATLVQPRAQRLQSVDQWQTVLAQVAKMDGVSVVAPVVAGAGFIVRGEANKAVGLTGIEPETYLQLIALNSKIIAGTANITGTDMLVGLDLAKDLGVWTGDKLNLQTASGGTATLSIRGIFDYGNSGMNSRSVYIALRTAQSLLDLAGGVTSVEVNLDAPFTAETVAQTIQAQTGLKVDSWIATNAQFFSALEAQSMSNTVIRFFVGLTAALGIASVLVVSVVQKSKAIGILRATGTSRQQILRLFLLQGALTGLIGSLLGAFVGWLFLIAWRNIAINADGTQLFPITFDPMLFVYAAVGATLVGILAALFPALQAARLDPAVAIRG